MSIPRIYHPGDYHTGDEIVLAVEAYNHIVRVLRLAVGAEITVFNGLGQAYQATITTVDKKRCHLKILTSLHQSGSSNESPLTIHLVQSLIKSEKMDFVIQKAVELGVSTITPLITRYCDLKLKGDWVEKKMKHWQAVIINACEQSGANRLPILNRPQKIANWFESLETTNAANSMDAIDESQLTIMFEPTATERLADLPTVLESYNGLEDYKISQITLLIGPEGGFSDQEINAAHEKRIRSICLGPRILRAETAALAAITIVQARWGYFF